MSGVRSQVRFPFVPKSNAYVTKGMFWAIPFADDSFAAGVVVGIPTPGDPHQPNNYSRIFTAGILGWRGDAVPTERDLVGVPLLDWGTAHVKSVNLTSDGVGLLGIAPSDWDGIPMVSHRGGGTVARYVNGVYERAATSDEAREMPVFGTWGLTYIRGRAEYLLSTE